MEKFIVSARKYRPQTFDTVVGQSHITTTLRNAIKHQQLAHAFLFCGPRGVGKTTCARILAKTINCENQTKEGEACDKCQSCISFNDGASMNYFELDGASLKEVQLGHVLQASPSLVWFSQLMVLANILAQVVLPTPLGPQKRKACASC